MLSLSTVSSPGPSNDFLFVVKIFLSKETVCSLRFMQQLLKGEKEYLLQSQVVQIAVPWFPELSIEALITKGENDPRIAKHIPDTTEKKKPNKDFVWHVINYFQPELIAQAIEDATKARIERRMR